MNGSLPKGWCLTTLGEVHKDLAQAVNPAKAVAETFELYSVPNFPKSEPEIVVGGRIGSSKQSVVAGTVLLCGINPRLNRVWVVEPRTNSRIIASTEWIPFFPQTGIPPKYLAYFLQQHKMRDFLAARASGVGGSLMRVKASTLSEFPFPLAPANQQSRIVGEIEKQFTRLDAAVAALKRVQANQKRYRAAVLKAACEGRLVPTEAELARREGRSYETGEKLLARILKERRARWEAERLTKMRANRNVPEDDSWKRKYKEPEVPDTRGLSSLPEGWTWATIDQVSVCLDGQRVPVNKDERLRRGGNIPYYGANGPVGVIDDYLFDEPLVLVVEDETFVGRRLPFSYLIKGKSWVNNHAHVLRPTGAVTAEFLNYSLAFYPFTPLTTGSTGRRKLTQRKLLHAQYALPPIAEQARIATEVERMLSIGDEIHSDLQKDVERADRLRQSLLKRAFEGKLVPQDPNDEPASVLLERIRAERTAIKPQNGIVPRRKATVTS